MNYEKHNDLTRALKDWHTGDCRKVEHKLDGRLYDVCRIAFPRFAPPYVDLDDPGFGLMERVPLDQLIFLANL